MHRMTLCGLGLCGFAGSGVRGWRRWTNYYHPAARVKPATRRHPHQPDSRINLHHRLLDPHRSERHRRRRLRDRRRFLRRSHADRDRTSNPLQADVDGFGARDGEPYCRSRQTTVAAPPYQARSRSRSLRPAVARLRPTSHHRFRLQAPRTAQASLRGHRYVGTPWLLDVHFINGTTGWAVGEHGTILKTINGGSGS